ncbi:MAG: HD domain-containing phosphohydrolase [Desulfovibrio sp.]
MDDLSNCKLLIAADVPADLKWLVDAFKGEYKLCVALEGRMALEHIHKQQSDIIILDVNMTGIDAYKACQDIKNDPETENAGVIFIDRHADDQSVERGYTSGADDYIINPHNELVMRKRVRQVLELVLARRELKNLRTEDVILDINDDSPESPASTLETANLEATAEKNTENAIDISLESSCEEEKDVLTLALEAALAKAADEDSPNAKVAENSFDPAHRDVLISLAAAAESPSEDTRKHIRRISAFCGLLAELNGENEESTQMISDAAILHDAGKMLIPDYILNKEGPLSKMEWLIMQQHTALGKGILESSDSDFMLLAREIASTHHEKWDGSGYPEKLSGEDIPLAGRICAIVDVFDALTTERPYKVAFAIDKSLNFMRQKRGIDFDPELFDLFEKNIDLFVLEMHRINGENYHPSNNETEEPDETLDSALLTA